MSLALTTTSPFLYLGKNWKHKYQRVMPCPLPLGPSPAGSASPFGPGSCSPSSPSAASSYSWLLNFQWSSARKGKALPPHPHQYTNCTQNRCCKADKQKMTRSLHLRHTHPPAGQQLARLAMAPAELPGQTHACGRPGRPEEGASGKVFLGKTD